MMSTQYSSTPLLFLKLYSTFLKLYNNILLVVTVLKDTIKANPHSHGIIYHQLEL